MPFTGHEGAKLYWDAAGSGEPLLLIMGLGYTSDMWFRVRPALEDRFRLIWFDNRGVGRSSVPPGPYSIPLLAADAAAVLDAAEVEAAHVFGISMGGMIAQEFALQYPGRVRKLGLGCTTCGYRHAVPASDEVLEKTRLRAGMSPEEGSWFLVPHIYAKATPRERIAEDIAVRVRTFPTAQGYLAQLAGIFAWDARDRISAIRAETLVIHGVEDELVPPGNAPEIARRIPGARLEMLPDASHIFFTDQPERSTELVRDFFSGPPRVSRAGMEQA